MMTTRVSAVAANADAELVNASLAGDREAFGQIVSRYQSLVCSLAYSATGSLSQSEDLAQETFFAAWQHLADLREPAKLRAWLCGIARNHIHNFLRAQGREPSQRAEPLDTAVEPPSPEPLPVERAISREEAEILWRSLERIPETYREPLVLFYREHRSIEAVAQDLELTEEAVRQRLSRGRKLLQAEVQAFVEGALEKTAPGATFTVAVVAALPLAVSSAKAAAVGIGVAKGGAGAKGVFSLAALGSLAAMLGAVLFSWKTAVDETKSPPERRLMVRTAGFQIAFFVLSMAAIFYGLPRLYQHPVAWGVGFALLLLVNVINAVVLADRLSRRRVEIVMEEGTWAGAEWSGPGRETDRQARRKATKLMVPILLLFVVGGLGLPWKQHGLRSLSVVAAEALVIVWGFRRYQRMLSGRFVPGMKPSRIPASLRHPLVLLPAIVFGSVLLGAGLVLYMNPGGAGAVIHHTPLLRNLGLSLLAALGAYGVFAVIYRKKSGMGLSHPLWPKTLALTTKLMAPMMGKMMLKSYAAVFEQIHLSPEQRAQLQDLILKKNAVNMDKGLDLMNPKLDAARRAALIQEMKNAREACDAEIRALLGREAYPVFERFEKSLPDRLVLGIFQSKLARMGAPLSPEEQAQLLQAISEAREHFPWSTDLSRRIQNPADVAAAFSEPNIATFAREEAEFDREFVARAQTILTPRQLAEFEPFLAKQRAAKIAAMRNTSRMFAPPGR